MSRCTSCSAVDGAHEAGHRLVHDGEELHDEVVAGDEVSALVGHDGLELVRGQTVDGALGQHDAAPHAGQAVCRGRRVLEDARVPVALRREQVDELAMPAAHAAQVAPHPVAGDEQAHRDDARDQRRHRRRPASCPASRGALPTIHGTAAGAAKSAASTAATAVDCHSTRAARGPRRTVVTRASSRGTGHASAIARATRAATSTGQALEEAARVARVAGLELGQRGSQLVDLLRGRLVEEVEQGRAPGVTGKLAEGVVQRLGGELGTGGGGGVAPGAAVALTIDEALLRHPVEHRHEGRVGEAAVEADAVVHLADGEARRGGSRGSSRAAP